MITKVQQVQSTKLLSLLVLLISFGGCNSKSDKIKQIVNKTVKVKADSLLLAADEGLFYYHDEPFLGISERHYENGELAEEIAYVNGVKNGVYKKWFDDGLLSFEANYVNGKQHGVTTSWWRNGKLRSESNYVNGIATGTQRQWYITGEPFKELNLVDGKEEGLQRTWRRNGKLYNNYEAKNGRIFGLKRANLCYALEDEEVQYKIL